MQFLWNLAMINISLNMEIQGFTDSTINNTGVKVLCKESGSDSVLIQNPIMKIYNSKKQQKILEISKSEI